MAVGPWRPWRLWTYTLQRSQGLGIFFTLGCAAHPQQQQQPPCRVVIRLRQLNGSTNTHSSSRNPAIQSALIKQQLQLAASFWNGHIQLHRSVFQRPAKRRNAKDCQLFSGPSSSFFFFDHQNSHVLAFKAAAAVANNAHRSLHVLRASTILSRLAFHFLQLGVHRYSAFG